MEIFENTKKAIIYHELGHWILAREFNFNAGDIIIELYPTMPITYSGSSQIFPEPSINNLDELIDYLKNRIAILLGGVISELLLEEDKSQENFDKLVKEHGKDDNKKIAEFLFIYSGVYFNNKFQDRKKQTELINQECHEYTFQKIKENKNYIKYLATKISTIIKKTGKEYTISKDDIENWLSEYKKQ